jgi:hypothetical protein
MNEDRLNTLLSAWQELAAAAPALAGTSSARWMSRTVTGGGSELDPAIPPPRSPTR